MNGDLWRVQFVSPHDSMLIDRTGQRTLAVSDYSTMIISIANNLRGELLNRVFIHELGPCAMFSYGLLPELRMLCNWRCKRCFRKPIYLCVPCWSRKNDCINENPIMPAVNDDGVLIF